MIFEDHDGGGGWWATAYIYVADSENVDALLGPFDTFDEATEAARRARHGVLHVEDV